MLEALKTIKNTYRVLMILSIGALPLTFVTRDSVDYLAALNDIEALERLEDVRLIELVGIHISYELELDNVSQGRIHFKKTYEYNDEIVEFVNRPANLITRLLRIIYDDANLTVQSATLNQIRRAFNQSIYVPIPKATQFLALRNCLQNSPDEGVRRIEIDVYEPQDDLSYLVKANSTARAMVGDRRCMTFNYTYSTLSKLLTHFLPVQSELAQALIDENYQSDNSISIWNITDRSMWQIVEFRTIPESKAELTRRLEGGERMQQVLGYAMVRETAIALLPMLILGFMILMIIHISAARRAVRPDPELSIPWIGWYDDLFSQVISGISLVFIPAFTMYRLYGILLGSYSWTKELSAVSVGAFGAIIWLSLRLLRKSIVNEVKTSKFRRSPIK